MERVDRSTCDPSAGLNPAGTGSAVEAEIALPGGSSKVMQAG
jgi:hypothetical protein